MLVAPESRFTETADDYDRARPGYPPALGAWLLPTARLAPGDRVADRAALERELLELFAVHAEDGLVAFDCDALALLWRPAEAAR